ncbi:unnamed protein product [Didymodactylos carnosus]|uniref:Rhamnogalacturonase A/B/Epimerase-like pectate lyase domain-containing protein n=1 Tax=Didymodactylos carnosus TaxID=1234261 RepID=A0A815AFQ8_9BILA|nr:unnamed protein product [Didymodactylos carnosus]CAF1256845.1 unnamed protein product [Didymodactylos carnosus]CAF3857642.1 unnamed protein product [Didymodactylos carnosus]CAF4030654.1 unnamed protein product [Didymodactylos carnosus]
MNGRCYKHIYTKLSTKATSIKDAGGRKQLKSVGQTRVSTFRRWAGLGRTQKFLRLTAGLGSQVFLAVLESVGPCRSLSHPSSLALHLTWLAQKIFNIKDYGAEGDGKTDNTEAITTAILAASQQSSGGYVYVPAGDFLSGALNLTSNVYLYLDHNSILRVSDDPALYFCVPSTTTDTGPCDFPFLFLSKLQHSGILGYGMIDAGANSPPGHLVREYDSSTNMLLPLEWKLPRCTYFSCRPKLMVIKDSSFVSLANLTITNSPLWTITAVESEYIIIDSVTILGDRRWPNNDGIDLINSRHVLIRNTTISTGDDCIAIVSHDSSAIFNITVENCKLTSTSAAIKISAFEQNATGNIYDLNFRNIQITDTNRGVCIAPRWGSGTLSNMTFTNLTMETHYYSTAWWGTAEPIYVTALSMSETRSWKGQVKNIHFENISARSEQGAILVGNTSILQNITLRNIQLTIDQFSNLSHPAHDYKPSIEPQFTYAPIDVALKTLKFFLEPIEDSKSTPEIGLKPVRENVFRLKQTTTEMYRE